MGRPGLHYRRPHDPTETGQEHGQWPGRHPGRDVRRRRGFFESVHGAAPKYAGRDRANPTAFILSAAALLCHLGEQAAGDAVECAVREVIAEGRTVTADLGGTAGTSEMADAVAARCT